MDDDITNAINSLESTGGVVPTTPVTDIPSAVDTTEDSLPPIVRPEDFPAAESTSPTNFNENDLPAPTAATDTVVDFSSSEPIEPVVSPMEQPVVPIETPEPILDTPLETPIPISEPAPIEQAYAPMPQLANEPYEAPDSFAYENKAPEVSSIPSPAMVPDPLYSPQDVPAAVAPSVAVDGSMMASPAAPKEPKQKAAISQSSKKLIFFGVAALLVVGTAVGGYFGFQAYKAASTVSLLTKAGKQLTEMPKMSTDFTLNFNKEEISGKVEVDGDKNIRFTTKNKSIPNAIVYLKKKDAVYVKEVMTTTSKTEKYTEYKQATDSVTKLTASTESGAPDLSKLKFTATTLKYLKRGASETVNGKKAVKYTFAPTGEALKEMLGGVATGDSLFGLDLANATLSVSFWLDEATARLVKVDGSLSIKIEGADRNTFGGPLPTDGQDDGTMSLGWKETFDYGYSGTIKLPIGAKITTAADITQALSGGATTNTTSSDATKKATVATLSAAIESYLVDNSSYPVAANTADLYTALTSGATPYLTGTIDLTGITYTLNEETSEYSLSFVLADQTATGENIEGTAPNKMYIVKN